MCLKTIDAFFDDKRCITVFLIFWLSLVLLVFNDLGLLNTQFMTFGPSEKTSFMGLKLDTWYRWGLVACFTFINTSVNDFMSDALSPWILNTITDHKNRFIPYSKLTCLLITQIWSIYCGVFSVIGIFLAMSQIDFVLIRMTADLTVNAYTTTKFMRNKTFCPEQYRRVSEMCMEGKEMTTIPLNDKTPLKHETNQNEEVAEV